MSPINDALKRAKETQKNNPPPAAGPQLRPVEPAQQARRGISLMLPFVLVVIALIGLLFAWQLRQKNNLRNQQPVETKSLAAANSEPVPKPTPAVQPVAVSVPKPIASNPPTSQKPVESTPVITPPPASAPVVQPVENVKPIAPSPAPVVVAPSP